jgi:hypothetical protein
LPDSRAHWCAGRQADWMLKAGLGPVPTGEDAQPPELRFKFRSEGFDIAAELLVPIPSCSPACQ